jgi:hypothetical protein
MDFWQSLALLGRHWRFFGVGLVLAVVLTAGVYESVKPQYQATTELLLLPPNISTVNLRNVSPYDAYGNLNTVAAIVSDAESSQGAANRLEQEGVTGTYTVGTDPTGAVPELILAVTASSAQAALQQDAVLTTDAITSLRQAQQLSGADSRTFVTSSYLARPVSAPKDDKSRLRVGVAAGFVLVFLAVALTFLYDSLTRRRDSSAGRDSEGEREMSVLRGADGSGEPRQEAQLTAKDSGTQSAKHYAPFKSIGQGSKRAATQPQIGAPGRASTPAQQAQDR